MPPATSSTAMVRCTTEAATATTGVVPSTAVLTGTACTSPVATAT